MFVLDGKRQTAMGAKGWRNANLRTQFDRIIRRAGDAPWPRLFNSLRASRETDLAKQHPLHVVTAWMGNTPKIAMKHYLMTTDADFERAAKSAAAGNGKEPHGKETADDAESDGAGFAGVCDSVRPSAQAFNGRGGIRTPGTLSCTPVFKTGAFNHSATRPSP